MGKFLESEKPKQEEFKLHAPYFSDNARLDGVYRGKPRSFCLPREYAGQNLFPEIRESAPAYFAEHGIHWHDGENGNPSNHLCDSQVCCVNFLFPFADKPDELAHILRAVFPDIQSMIPVEKGLYVAFEWIGLTDHLGEVGRGGRTRGANCTSADAIVMFKQRDGKRHIVLIEWKYTESYRGTPLHHPIRMGRYRPLFDSADCPLQKKLLTGFDALFYEPFYQFMRQQFLANQMEKARELEADCVSVLHIAPAHNLDFQNVTSPDLAGLGTTATGIWKRLTLGDRFISTNTESLFGNLSTSQFPTIKPWMEYISSRYPWVREP